MSLPPGWAECRLEDLLAPEPDALVDGPFGSSLKSEHYAAEGCRVIRLNNIGIGHFIDDNRVYIDAGRFQTLRRHDAQPGDLVTAALGEPLGRTCVVPDGLGPAIVKADCFRARLSRRVDARLVAFWLNSPTLSRYFADNGKGVGRVRINLSTLRNAPLPLPPEQEQTPLARRLEGIVSRAERARTEADHALRNTQALKLSGLRAGTTGRLTDHWRATSGHLEAVETLLARTPAPEQGSGGRDATEVRMPGLAAIAVNDPKTELPKGWQWVPLLRIARQETGHTPSRRRPDFWDGNIDWLGIRDARDHHGQIVERTVRQITEAGLNASSARLLPPQTVCLSRTASVGYVTILGRTMATSQDFVTWTCTPALLPEYLMYALMAEGKRIRQFGRGSTHTTIYFPELRAFHIALPPIDEQHVIVARIKRILHRADALAAEAVRAGRLADQLATRAVRHAMSGKLWTSSGAGETASDLLITLHHDRNAAMIREKAIRTRSRRPQQPETTEIALDTQEQPMTTEELTAAIRKAGGKMRSDALWRRSGLPIEEFYRSLRSEIAAGRIREATDKEHLVAD